MEQSKNSPPKGYLIGLLVFVAIIIGYFVLISIFPDIFNGLSTSRLQPVDN